MLSRQERNKLKNLLNSIDCDVLDVQDLATEVITGRGFDLSSIEKERLGVRTSAMHTFTENVLTEINNLKQIVEIK